MIPNSIYDFCILLSGMGLVHFGGRVLSGRMIEIFEEPIFHSLQKIRESGPSAFVRGFLLTMLSFSTVSSIITIGGLMNAGLVRMRPGVKLILGANIGAALSVFILSLFPHFTCFIFLGVGLIIALATNISLIKNIGGVLFSLGLILIGLQWFELGFNSIDIVQGNLLLFCIITFSFLTGLLLKSSTGVLLLTVFFPENLLSDTGIWLGLIGVNLGSSLPVLFASRKGNHFGKRAGVAHLLIKLLVSLTFILFLNLKVWSFSSAWGVTGAHLFINLFIALLLYGFVKPFESLISELWKNDEPIDSRSLEVLGDPLDMVPALGITQARFQILKIVDVVQRIFELTYQYVEGDEAQARTLAKIKDYERITDNMQEELNEFLGLLVQNTLSHKQSMKIQGLVRMSEELETISDYIDKVATYNTRFLSLGHLPKEVREEYLEFYNQVLSFFMQVSSLLGWDEKANSDELLSEAMKLKKMADEIRERHIKRMDDKHMEPAMLLLYSDMVVSLRKVRGHTLRIFNAYKNTL